MNTEAYEIQREVRERRQLANPDARVSAQAARFRHTKNTSELLLGAFDFESDDSRRSARGASVEWPAAAAKAAAGRVQSIGNDDDVSPVKTVKDRRR